MVCNGLKFSFQDNIKELNSYVVLCPCILEFYVTHCEGIKDRTLSLTDMVKCFNVRIAGCNIAIGNQA
jgi:hypothetical protein